MTRHLSKLQIDLAQLGNLIDLTIDNLNEMYPELKEKKEIIKTVIIEEKDKFIKTLGHGEKEFEKVIAKLKQENKKIIDGQTIFKLYETYGFPPEITADLAKEQGFEKSPIVYTFTTSPYLFSNNPIAPLFFASSKDISSDITGKSLFIC